MNELDLAMQRHKKRRIESSKEGNKLSQEFSKILLSIIFVLSSVIFMKLDEDNKIWFKKNVLESNLEFMKINEWYHHTFGEILPSVVDEKSSMVISEARMGERENYLDGYKIKTLKNTPVKTITSGLLVYMGEKEGYKNTFIIQGVDGIDIWYGNIDNTNFKLYDYIEEGQILGESIEEEYYLVFEKDGKMISYEEYFQQI